MKIELTPTMSAPLRPFSFQVAKAIAGTYAGHVEGELSLDEALAQAQSIFINWKNGLDFFDQSEVLPMQRVLEKTLAMLRAYKAPVAQPEEFSTVLDRLAVVAKKVEALEKAAREIYFAGPKATAEQWAALGAALQIPEGEEKL